MSGGRYVYYSDLDPEERTHDSQIAAHFRDQQLQEAQRAAAAASDPPAKRARSQPAPVDGAATVQSGGGPAPPPRLVNVGDTGPPRGLSGGASGPAPPPSGYSDKRDFFKPGYRQPPPESVPEQRQKVIDRYEKDSNRAVTALHRSLRSREPAEKAKNQEQVKIGTAAQAVSKFLHGANAAHAQHKLASNEQDPNEYTDSYEVTPPNPRAAFLSLSQGFGVPKLRREDGGGGKTLTVKLGSGEGYVNVEVPRKDPRSGQLLSTTTTTQRGVGGSSKYSVLADKNHHPAQLLNITQVALQNQEAARSRGRDLSSVVVKNRLVGSKKLAPPQAIDPFQHGTYELPGAQSPSPELAQLIARNTANTIELYGEGGGSRPSSPRGQDLRRALEEIAEKGFTRERVLRGAVTLRSIADQTLGPLTPPGSQSQNEAWEEIVSEFPYELGGNEKPDQDDEKHL